MAISTNQTNFLSFINKKTKIFEKNLRAVRFIDVLQLDHYDPSNKMRPAE